MKAVFEFMLSQMTKPKSNSCYIFDSDRITRVQLKPNWTVGDRLLASDEQAFCKCRLSLFKSFVPIKSRLEINWFRKCCLWRSVLLMTRNTQETNQTLKWPWESIILLVGHFVGSNRSSTEQLVKWY